MLKTTELPNKPAPNRNNSSKSPFSRNNNNGPVFGRNDGNSKVDEFDNDNIEHIKKSRKSKIQKLAKPQKLSMSRKLKSEKSKKLSKSRNSPNFNFMEARLNFLTVNVRTAFNHL